MSRSELISFAIELETWFRYGKQAVVERSHDCEFDCTITTRYFKLVYINVLVFKTDIAM